MWEDSPWSVWEHSNIQECIGKQQLQGYSTQLAKYQAFVSVHFSWVEENDDVNKDNEVLAKLPEECGWLGCVLIWLAKVSNLS